MRAIVTMTAVAFVMVGAAILIGPVRSDEAPQQVNTKGLPKLGDKWLDKNPFAGNKTAIDVGSSAYNQNCARCHGLEMISGGIAPDLRHVPLDQDGDDLFLERMHKGATRNGMTLMPVFAGLLPQETLWAIRAYMVSKHIPD